AILLQASVGATAAIKRTPLTYDPATQSHPGACSQDTLNVGQAVGDLSANGVLGQYAVLVGVHATGSALTADMKQTLTVLKVLKTTVTANHGCTTYGVIFRVGQRTLTKGETVGVALPASIRAKLCRGPAAGCRRRVLTERTVFPTNCWNLDQGNVQVAVYLHKPKPKPNPKPKPKPTPKPTPKPKPTTKAKVKLARPSAHAASTCGVNGPGYETLTLSNGAGATAAATFEVNGKGYGPVAAGKSLTVTVGLASGNTALKVSSGGDVLLHQSVPSDQCPVAPASPPVAPTSPPVAPTSPPVAPTSAPMATAALSCQAGGVIVTLSNGAAATAVASFDVNGTTYGPLNPGATETVTVPVSSGATGKLTVTSGTSTLINGASYIDSCAAHAGATFVGLFCTPTFGEAEFPPGGGVLVVQLMNAADATLPASFTVSATGSTTAGYGPATIGPLAAGGSQTLLIPVDASGNTITLSVTSGGVPVAGGVQTITGGCLGRQQEAG
ncbi:MAG: hypothetical protein ACRDLT_07845, partial [Solirubrobacteraceae bacterium]